MSYKPLGGDLSNCRLTSVGVPFITILVFVCVVVYVSLLHMYTSIRPLFIRLNCYFEMKKNVVSFLVSLLQWISFMLVSIYFTSVFTIFILDLELFRPCGIICFFILCFPCGCFESWALFIIEVIANVKWRTVNNQCFF